MYADSSSSPPLNNEEILLLKAARTSFAIKSLIAIDDYHFQAIRIDELCGLYVSYCNSVKIATREIKSW